MIATRQGVDRVTAVILPMLAMLVAGAASVGCRPRAEGPTVQDPVREPAARTASGERSLRFQGLARTYRVHVPASYGGSREVPLVLAFHGRLGTGEAQRRLSGLDEVADRHGFLVVYPDGVGRSWNAGHGAGAAQARGVDDVAFVAALIDELAHEWRIDRRRVYAMGMSNGAIFVHRLACELSERIAAVAAVAGTLATETAESCQPARPVSILQIHGTSDGIVPWAGGRIRSGGEVESVEETIRFWIEKDGCAAEPQVDHLGKRVVSEHYTGCAAGTEVRLYRVERGGHTWPGGDPDLPRVIVGRTEADLDASEIIWRFYERHSRQR